MLVFFLHICSSFSEQNFGLEKEILQNIYCKVEPFENNDTATTMYNDHILQQKSQTISPWGWISIDILVEVQVLILNLERDPTAMTTTTTSVYIWCAGCW